MEKMDFESRKFCQLRTLMHRWDCSRSFIYDMVSKGRLKLWHPDGVTGKKGIKIEVEGVLLIEAKGRIY